MYIMCVRMLITVDLYLPSSGAPMAAATPWNINKTPKAFVSSSSPVNSTIIVDLKDAKQAKVFDGKTNRVNVWHIAMYKQLFF